MTISSWFKFVQLLLNMFDFVAVLSKNVESIKNTWGRWSDVVEDQIAVVILPHTASFQT